MLLEERKLERYADELDKGIEFTYEEFEKQLRDEWMQGYNLAYRFYIFHNTLDVPLDYFIDGFPLGHWVEEQRRLKKDLTVNQSKLMDNIGIQWNIGFRQHMKRAQREIRYGEEQYGKWIDHLLEAQEFYNKHGHLNIPIDTITYNKDGKPFHLGAWIQSQRQYAKDGRLPAERMSKLDSIFMVYDFTHKKEIERIQRVRKHDYLPRYFRDIDPFSEKQSETIFNNGPISRKMRLERNISYLQAYFEENGDLDIPKEYMIELENGLVVRPGLFLMTARGQKRKGQINPELEAELERMNVCWNPIGGRQKKESLPERPEQAELLALREAANNLASNLQNISEDDFLECMIKIEEDFPIAKDFEEVIENIETTPQPTTSPSTGVQKVIKPNLKQQ